MRIRLENGETTSDPNEMRAYWMRHDPHHYVTLTDEERRKSNEDARNRFYEKLEKQAEKKRVRKELKEKRRQSEGYQPLEVELTKGYQPLEENSFPVFSNKWPEEVYNSCATLSINDASTHGFFPRSDLVSDQISLESMEKHSNSCATLSTNTSTHGLLPRSDLVSEQISFESMEKHSIFSPEEGNQFLQLGRQQEPFYGADPASALGVYGLSMDPLVECERKFADQKGILLLPQDLSEVCQALEYSIGACSESDPSRMRELQDMQTSAIEYQDAWKNLLEGGYSVSQCQEAVRILDTTDNIVNSNNNDNDNISVEDESVTWMEVSSDLDDESLIWTGDDISSDSDSVLDDECEDLIMCRNAKTNSSQFEKEMAIVAGALVEVGCLPGGFKKKKVGRRFKRLKGRKRTGKRRRNGARSVIGGIPLHSMIRLEEMVKGLMTNVGSNDCSINFGLTVLGGTGLLTTTPMTQFLGETQLPNLYTKARVERITIRISWNNSEVFPMAVYAYITNIPPTNNAAVNYLEAHEKIKGRLSRVYKFVLEHGGLRAANGTFSFSVSPKRIYGNPTQYEADSNTMIAITPNLGGVPTYAAPSNNVFLVMGAQSHLVANVFTASGVRFNCTMIKTVHLWEKVPQIQ